MDCSAPRAMTARIERGLVGTLSATPPYDPAAIRLTLADEEQGRAVGLFEEVDGVVALVGGGAGDVGDGVRADQADQQKLAGFECVQSQAGADEGHRAGLIGDVDCFVMKR